MGSEMCIRDSRCAVEHPPVFSNKMENLIDREFDLCIVAYKDLSENFSRFEICAFYDNFRICSFSCHVILPVVYVDRFQVLGNKKNKECLQ